MAVPKLPLVVPKKAISTTSALVPKIAPKLAPVLLPKGPPLAKSLHSGSNFPPTKLVNDNSVQKTPEKLTKLVSNSNLGASRLNSVEESRNEPDSTNADLNTTETKVAPAQPFSQGSKNFEGKKSLFNGRRESNSSFHDDLATRLNNSGVLNDFAGQTLKKSLSKSVSKDNFTTEKPLKAESLEHDKFVGDSNGTNECNSSNKTKNDKFDFEADERDDVGYTPWLKIERRINQIRSMTSKDFKAKPATKKSPGPSLYNNYNTEYEEGRWKKELTNPLSFGMVQKLNDKRQFELPKDNWKFINGFLKPRRKPFTSMSEMSKHFQKVDAKDQYELIKLLLACRDLEKLIEEQHTVLDMLDHDLREARDLFPDSLNNVTTQKLHGSVPDEEPFFPSNEAPLFIKGRVFLLPNKGKNNNGKGNK